MSDKKYVTRREGVQLAREQGIPLTLGRVNKDVSDGRGPKHSGRYGPTYLYTPEDFLSYAVERVMKDAAA